ALGVLRVAVPVGHDSSAARRRRPARLRVQSYRCRRPIALTRAPRGGVASDRAFSAQLRDLVLGVAEAREHLVGVLAQTRRRGLDARTAIGELERGHRHGDGALDAVDLLVAVQYAPRCELRILQ